MLQFFPSIFDEHKKASLVIYSIFQRTHARELFASFVDGIDCQSNLQSKAIARLSFQMTAFNIIQTLLNSIQISAHVIVVSILS